MLPQRYRTVLLPSKWGVRSANSTLVPICPRLAPLGARGPRGRPGRLPRPRDDGTGPLQRGGRGNQPPHAHTKAVDTDDSCGAKCI